MRLGTGSGDEPGFGRVRHGRGFRYLDTDTWTLTAGPSPIPGTSTGSRPW